VTEAATASQLGGSTEVGPMPQMRLLGRRILQMAASHEIHVHCMVVLLELLLVLPWVSTLLDLYRKKKM